MFFSAHCVPLWDHYIQWKWKYFRGQLKCDGTRAETRFRLSAKRSSLFKSSGASVQSTTGSRGVRISGSDAGYTMFRGRVKDTGYPLHSPVSPSLPLPSVTVCHHISTGLYRYVIVQCFILLIRGRAHLNAAGLSVTDVRKQNLSLGRGWPWGCV